MKYLQPAMGFHVELPEASLLIAVKGYKLIKGSVPSKYGDIMDDIPIPNETTLEHLSFHEVFEELMTKSKLFLEEKFLTSKNIFFLRKCEIYGTYHWVDVHAWSEGTYTIGENPNENFFVESWRSDSVRKHLLAHSIFFILQSRKKLQLNTVTILDKPFQDLEKEIKEPRVCPRCKGTKVDPHHFQDDCQRCGGIGTVYGNERKWSPPQFID